MSGTATSEIVQDVLYSLSYICNSDNLDYMFIGADFNAITYTFESKANGSQSFIDCFLINLYLSILITNFSYHLFVFSHLNIDNCNICYFSLAYCITFI